MTTAVRVDGSHRDSVSTRSVAGPDRRTRGFTLTRWAVVLAPALIAVLAISAYGVAHVENDSMQPTLHGGDLVIFDRFSAPERGDIVLFSDPAGWSSIAGATLVKRVVGVSGDTVVCCEVGTGRLLVNDVPLVEPYTDPSRPGGTVPFRVTVPVDTVWVMGDHRSASVDSRSAVNDPGRGGIALDAISGVVRVFWGAPTALSSRADRSRRALSCGCTG